MTVAASNGSIESAIRTNQTQLRENKTPKPSEIKQATENHKQKHAASSHVYRGTLTQLRFIERGAVSGMICGLIKGAMS